MSFTSFYDRKTCYKMTWISQNPLVTEMGSHDWCYDVFFANISTRGFLNHSAFLMTILYFYNGSKFLLPTLDVKHPTSNSSTRNIKWCSLSGPLNGFKLMLPHSSRTPWVTLNYNKVTDYVTGHVSCVQWQCSVKYMRHGYSPKQGHAWHCLS